MADEYIEREATYALSKIICDAIRNREYHPANFGRFILDRIDDIPAADVAPVRHGRWERHFSRPYVYADMFWHCSVCGYKNIESFADAYHHYCPNCGAKMDKYRLSCPSKD